MAYWQTQGIYPGVKGKNRSKERVIWKVLRWVVITVVRKSSRMAIPADYYNEMKCETQMNDGEKYKKNTKKWQQKKLAPPA